MGDNSRKKERRRIKRLRKLREIRRRNAVSPYIRAAEGAQVKECLVNDGWREKGIASVMVLLDVRGGLAVASFLVDMWCAGLKDAWGRLDITREEYDRAADNMVDGAVEIDPDAVRRLVAGAIRFANQNGFRLPRHYERWTAMLGGVPDWRTADLSDFGYEGGLFWMGTMEDLRGRLIGCSAEEFLARKDVHYTIGGPMAGQYISEDGEGLEDGDEEDDAAIEEECRRGLEDLRRQFCDAARRWCFANGEVPLALMADAAFYMIVASHLDSEDFACDTLKMGDSMFCPLAVELARMNSDLTADNTQRAKDLRAALDQLRRFSGSFRDADEFARAITPDQPIDLAPVLRLVGAAPPSSPIANPQS
ncbi:MAG: hypothetical protein ACE15C_00815 [Phycisphaerae bacterium]